MNNKSCFFSFISKWDMLEHDSPQTSYQCDYIIVIIDEDSTKAPNLWTCGNCSPYLASYTTLPLKWTMVACTTLRNSTIIFALFWGFCFEFQTGPNFHLDSLILKLIMFLRRTQRVTDVFILQLSLPTVFSGNISTTYFFHLNIWLFYHMNLLSLWILFSHISTNCTILWTDSQRIVH